MKLKQSNKKKRLIIILAVLAVVLIAVVALGVGMAVKYFPGITEPEGTVSGISVNEVPKTSYFVGEELDFTGLRIQVLTNTVGELIFVSYPSDGLTVGECDMSVAGQKTITVTYGGFTTSFNITVNEYSKPESTVVSIEVRDLRTTYSVGDWNRYGPIIDEAYLIITYSDGSTKGSFEETPLSWDYIDALSKVSGAGTTEITVNYTEKGITASTSVTITITE